MKKVLISRYGAYGDHIHASHLPRLLKEKEGFDYVAFQYNLKGLSIHKNNPLIDEHIIYEPSHMKASELALFLVNKRLEYLSENGHFDKVIDLQFSLEQKSFAMENQGSYYRDSNHRAKINGGLNLYDQTTICAGYPQYVGMVGELHFTQAEEDMVQGIYEREYKDKFVIMLNLSGSSKQKMFVGAEEVIKKFLARHPDAVCITNGDEDCREHIEFHGERIINRAGNFKDGKVGYPFRQAMLMTKYASMAMGYESGLMCASTLLGTPTLQLMTTACIKNHGGDFPNDYSLQSPCYCSPCFKGPYQFVGCPNFEYLGERYPKCILFNTDLILNLMEEVYKKEYACASSR